MPQSAYNRSSSNIYPGFAVVVNGNAVRLPDAGETATHVAMDGAPPGGVLTVGNAGSLDLNDWTLATGGKYLTAGSTYYVTATGSLVADVGQQAVGVATSRTVLAVSVVPYQTVTPATTVKETSPAPLQTALIAGSGSPLPDAGTLGAFYIDRVGHTLYGPKSTGGWGEPWPFWSS